MEKMQISNQNYAKDQKGNRMFQYLAMSFGTLNMICSGMHYGWASPSLPQLLNGNITSPPITSEEGSWIAVMPLIGSLLGGLLGGIVLMYIGRKKVIVFLSIPYLTAWLMVAFAKSVRVLFIARFFAGISDGLGFCVVPMYLGEIADPKIRGIIGSSVGVTTVFGIVLINIMGAYLSISKVALIASVIPLTCFITFLWMPESPYYLVMKGELEEARKSLIRFKGTTNVEEDLDRMVISYKEMQKDKGKFTDLFAVKSNRKAMFIAMGIRTFQQLCGITAITFYAQIIFKEANSVIAPHIATILYFTVQLICGGVSSLLVDRTGRKPLLIISIIGTAISLFVEGIYFYLQNMTDVDTSGVSSLPIVALVCFIILFSVGMQSIPILLLGEIFPTNIKSYAISFNDIYFCLVATMSSKFFQFTKDNYGIHVPFFVFSGCCVFALIFIILIVPETTRKTLEQIQLELKGETCEKFLVNEIPETRETLITKSWRRIYL